MVNTKTIANVFGLTERRVRQLVDESIIDKVGTGRFNLLSTVKKYIAYLRATTHAEREGNKARENLDYEKFLHERAKRELAELELARVKGQMHDASEVERIMTKMLADFRAKLLAMPTKVAPALVARNEISVIQDILQRDVYEILEELSDYDPSLFSGDKVDNEEEAEGTEDE